MKVGIAGAGAIALATAACLDRAGHGVSIWSPSGDGTKPFAEHGMLTTEGAFEHAFPPQIAPDAATLAEQDVLIVAVPGYGHRAVFDALVPHLRPRHRLVISSHVSFGALYVAKALAARGFTIPIVAWGTTLVTGRRGQPGHVRINTVRSRIDVGALPLDATDQALELCRQLAGDRFVARDGLMAIALSNLNPQNHLGIALANMTRMERGETWSQALNVTPNVGRLLEALDLERLAIATRAGVEVRTIREHFHLSFHVPVAGIAEMNAAMHAAGNGGVGPATADTRYVTEDVPFGLVPTVWLGERAGTPAPLHDAGVTLLSAMYGRDFRRENDLLPALELDRLELADLQELSTRGYMRAEVL